MKCQKCEGKGWIHNNKYYTMASCVAYERGIESRKECNDCKGSGYIIGDVKDVIRNLEYLLHTAMGREERKIIQQCLDVITKH